MIEYLVVRTVYTLLTAMYATLYWDTLALNVTTMRATKKQKVVSEGVTNGIVAVGILLASLLPEVMLAAVLVKWHRVKHAKK